MKWIVDAQLPKRLAYLLRDKGHHAFHTLELPNKNSSSDEEIRELSVTEQRIVISKDADFLESYLLRNVPYKLLIIATGNISNDKLLQLFEHHFDRISVLFSTHHVLELTKETLIIRH